ncbi:MAG: hypothetical protein RIC57_04160 [Balneola sp.]
MSGFDPFLIEQKYNETIRLIQSSPSERIQLTGINTFLEDTWNDRTQVSSYLEQILQYLPDLSNPLLIAGINPLEFKKFIERLEIISEVVDADKEIELKLIQYNKSLLQINSWVGEDQNKRQGDVIQLEGENKPTYKPGEVLIPVVEELKTANSQAGIGRLRQLRVDILGENKKGKSELKPAFGVIGKDSGSFLEGVSKVAEKLLSVSKKGKHKHWRATASLSMSHAWHAGRSANLALASAFYCEMLKAEEMAEFFRLNPAICVSGDVDDFGNVLAVEEKSLGLKTEAAFFSWVQVLVVPAEQLEIVQNKVRELNEHFPNRQLPVFGVSKIEEIFYDRRLTIHQKTDAIIHNLRRVWKRKFGVASGIMLMILLSIIARLVYGPVDRNPTYVTYEGEYAEIRNKSGAILEEVYVGEVFVENFNKTNGFEAATHIVFFDIDKDGVNEIFENTTVLSNTIEKDNKAFIIRSLDGDTLLKRDFHLDIRFDNHPYVKEEKYGIRKFVIADINSDGTEEVIMLLPVIDFFSQLLITMDIQTGEITNKYINAGYMREFLIRDLDGNGTNEIMLAAELKAYNSQGLIVLDGNNFHGSGVLGNRYKKSDFPKAKEIAVILIPQTILGKVMTNLYSPETILYGMPRYFRERREGYFSYVVDDHKSRGNPTSSLIYDFYDDLNLRSIISTDSYDYMSKQLYQEGHINFEIDALYLDTYRDSLQYWNGTEFQNTPTLNRKYLEAVGEDSTFYKEFYFNTYE